MPSKVTIPRIKVFPRDGQIWRIDWLGAINANAQKSIEPTIDVIISPLQNEPVMVFGDDSWRFVIKVGVGLLPFLRVGSLWLDGRPHPGFLGAEEKFHNVVVSSSTVKYFCADEGEEVWKSFNVVPRYEYDFGDAGRNAQCIAVQRGDDPYGIILPAIEAIRFYYAGSTNLTSLTLFGAYENYLNDIINREKSGYLDEKKRCILQLRRWITDDDGWTIGRVLHEPLARAGVRKVYDSILPYSIKGAPAYPTCSLPFEGLTKWTARGVWIESGLRLEKRFLVFELLRCSSPFPFDELHVIRDNDGRKASEETDIPEEEKKPGWAIPKKGEPQDGKEAELQSEEDPQRDIAPLYLPMIGERFDALDNKEVMKTEKEKSPYKGVKLSGLATVPVESYSTGKEMSGDHPVGSFKIQEHQRRKGVAPSFDVLVEAVGILNSTYGLRASMRSMDCDAFRTPLLGLSGRRQWPYLDYKTGELRRVWAIDIKFRGSWSCFIDFELRKRNEHTAGLVRHLAGGRISSADFVSILYRLSESKGSWDKTVFARHAFGVVQRKHTWTNANECARAIAAIL